MKVTDPVCGMTIESEDASASFEHQGKTYYFCAPGCREAFEKAPEQYVKKDEPEQHGHRCC